MLRGSSVPWTVKRHPLSTLESADLNLPQRAQRTALAGLSIPALPFGVAADVAQLVEQRFCKPQVPGSSPVVGSNNRERVSSLTTEASASRGARKFMGTLSRW